MVAKMKIKKSSVKTKRSKITKSKMVEDVEDKSLKTTYKRPKKGKYHRGIVLLHHIPHGFYEKEMKSYFSQFGKVMRLRVARSGKTGKSKGYAFVEFEFEEVAKIVAETMNNYLMFERLIKSSLLPQDVSAKRIFKSSYIKEDHYPKLIARKYEKARQEEFQTDKEVKEVMQGRIKKLQEQNEKLLSLGINYQYNSDEEPDSDTDTDEAEVVKIEDDSNSESIPEEEPSPAVMKSLDKSITKKTPKIFDKFSPKFLRSKADKSISKTEVVAVKTPKEIPLSKKAIAEKLEKSKISPKLLRSRKSEVSHSAITSEAAKLFDTKVSPKNMRKRKSEPNPQKDPIESLPKISPKFLRSRARKSEVPMEQTPTPVTPKNKRGRKSVF